MENKEKADILRVAKDVREKVNHDWRVFGGYEAAKKDGYRVRRIIIVDAKEWMARR